MTGRFSRFLAYTKNRLANLRRTRPRQHPADRRPLYSYHRPRIEPLEYRLLLTQFAVHHPPRVQLGNAPLAGFVGSSHDQVDVLWQTVDVAGGAEDAFSLEYRAGGTNAAWQDGGPISQLATGVGKRTIHSASITGLAWDSDYEYRVQQFRDGVPLAAWQNTFHTRLYAGDTRPFSFAAYGDSAGLTTIEGFNLVQGQINAGPAAFSLLLGDNAYPDGTHKDYDVRFDPDVSPEAAQWNASHIDFVAIGNHDVHKRKGLATEQNYSVPIPVAGTTAAVAPPKSERLEHNYSFDYGDVHFVTFDTNDKNDERLDRVLDWVVADLKASTAKWKVVFGHHPVGGAPDKPNKPSDDYYKHILRRLGPDDAQADLFMMGHSHTFGWTYPLTGQSGGQATFVNDPDKDYGKGAGLVQVISGAGGKSLRPGKFNKFPFVASGFSTSTSPPLEYGYALVQVTANQLKVQYIAADDGAVIDQFTITGGADVTPSTSDWATPKDNGAGDFNPALDSVTVIAPQPVFEIQLSDIGDGIDDSTVSQQNVVLRGEGTRLVAGVDYLFSYTASTDRISLTSLGGDFGAGTYEVELNAGLATIADKAGNLMPTQTLVIEIITSVQTRPFQQGASGYVQTVDTFLREPSPAVNNASTTPLTVDDDEQTLLRFDSVFGIGPGQIPAGSTVFSATLELEVSNSGSAMALHRLLQPWVPSDNWNSLGAGIQADGVEAAVRADATTESVPLGPISIDVSRSLQNWSRNPASNLGWVILSTGINGVDFDSAEGATPPRLEVTYSSASLPLVTMEATDDKGAEAGLDPALFTVRRFGDTSADLVVPLAAEGTATAGVDYRAIPNSVTIPAGSSQTTIVITPIDDSNLDGDETLIVAVIAASAYNLGSPSADMVTLTDNDPLLLLSDSFEVSPWNNLWEEAAQSGWSRSTLRAADGDHSAEVRGPTANGTLTLATPIDLRPFAVVTLSFSWFIETRVDSGEYLALDLFDGTSWHEVRRLEGDVDEENAWQHEELSILLQASDGCRPSHCGSSLLDKDFKFRFRGQANRSTEAGYVDNVRLIATSPAPPNQPPVADAAGPYTLSEGSSTQLNATASSDADGKIVEYAWDLDHDGQFDNASGTTTNFNSTVDGLFNVVLRVTDNDDAIGTQTTTVTVNNVAPTADAGGPYITAPGISVAVNAGGSTDPGNDIASYEWDLDHDGQYDDATGEVAVFNAATEGTFTVAVKVTDDDGASTTDATVVTVSHPVVTIAASDPQATEAGPVEGRFTITRTGVTAADLQVVYSVGGAATAGSDYQPLSESLTIPAGSSAASLVVLPIDDDEFEYEETVVITLVDAADYHLGTESDAAIAIADNESALLFADSFELGEWHNIWVEDAQDGWSRSNRRATEGGRSAELAGPVSDAALSLAAPIDLRPYTSVVLHFAWFIESRLDPGEFVALDFYDGSWEQVHVLRGNLDVEDSWHEEEVSLSSSHLVKNFMFRFRGTANKSSERGNVDDIQLIATGLAPPNQPPVANPGGPYTIDEGSPVQLDGSASSDPDGKIVGYHWDLSGDGQYDNASGTTAGFSSAEDGQFTIGLQVIDNDDDLDAQTSTITVNNVAPTATAGGPYAAETRSQVVLTASGSTDPGNDIVSYEWDLDNDGQFDDATGVTAAFSSNTEGSFTVHVRVADDDGAVSTDNAAVTVKGPTVTIVATTSPVNESGQPSGAFTITRSGDTASELVVDYLVAGTATPEADYDELSGTAAIPAGSSETSLLIAPLDDSDIEGDETVLVTLADTDTYSLGSPFSAAVTLADDDQLLLLSNSFEPHEWDGVWSGHNDWSRSTQRATDGASSAQLTGPAKNATLTFTSPVDLRAFQTVALDFSWFIESGIDTGEYLALDLYDGKWQQVLTLDGNLDPENRWLAETVFLEPRYLLRDFVFRFRGKANKSNERAYVDHVQLIVHSFAPPNQPPAADAGGPYTVNEGSSLKLDGSASADSDGTIVRYEWDLDNDGQYDDAAGEIASFMSTIDGQYNIALRVTDNDDDTGEQTTNLTVNNVAPTADAGGPYSTQPGIGVVVTAGGSTDPGNDIVDYEWDLDQDGQFDDATGISATFNSAQEGRFTVSVRVTDDDGAATIDSATVTVDPPAVTIVATDNEAAEAGLEPGVLTVTRSGATTLDLQVLYSTEGTATAGSDYAALPGTVTIPAGSSQVDILLRPIDDSHAEDAESVIVRLLDADAYDLSSPSSAEVQLVDDDQELLLFDSFESSEWHALWLEDAQASWSRSTQRATDGAHSAELSGPAREATLTTAAPIDLSNYERATLSFAWFIERGIDTGEYLALDFYRGSWQQVLVLRGNVDREDSWHQQTVSVPSEYFAADFRLRFRGQASKSNEQANVDHIQLIGASRNNTPNQPPLADPGGPYTTSEGSDVPLDGSASSDPDGTIVSYHWDLDSDGQYHDAAGATATFNSTVDGVFPIGLRVTDDGGETHTQITTVAVNNVPPTADAGGPYTGAVGVEVTVTAAGSSDPGNDIVSYEWDLDNDGLYDDAAGVTAAFKAATEGSFSVAVRVTDDDGQATTDTAIVTSTASAGIVLLSDSFELAGWNGVWVEDLQDAWLRSPQRASAGEFSAQVQGPASDATLTLGASLDLSAHTSATLSFSWLITRGIDTNEYLAVDFYNGSWHQVLVLRGNVDPENAWHRETIAIPGSYLVEDFKLRFRGRASKANEQGNVDDLQLVAGKLPNQPPLADTGGPYTTAEGSDLQLDGSASSDSDGAIVSYDWDLDHDGQYDDATGMRVIFNSRDDGLFQVGLRVTDDGGESSTQTTSVTVSNVAPTAAAGGPYRTAPGVAALLTAAGSTDPGDDVVAYEWDLDLDGQFDDATGITASFSSASPGTFTVAVRVSDDDGAVATDSGVVTVTPAPTKFFVVDNGADSTFEYQADGTFVTNYNLQTGNTSPRGVTAGPTGSTLWVIDSDESVYVYDTSGNLLRSWQASGLVLPEGIASDGVDVWIVDRDGAQMHYFAGGASFAHGITAGPTSSFNLAAHDPRGVTTEGTHLWVVDAGTDRVFKYTVGGILLGSWAIDPDNRRPSGITIDPSDVGNIWIVDSSKDRVYEYRAATDNTSGTHAAAAEFSLTLGNRTPQGIADPPPAGQGHVRAEESIRVARHLPWERWIVFSAAPFVGRGEQNSVQVARLRAAQAQCVPVHCTPLVDRKTNTRDLVNLKVHEPARRLAERVVDELFAAWEWVHAPESGPGRPRG